MKSKITFGDSKLKKEFDKISDKDLKKQLLKAFDNLEENSFCGIQIPKKLIPKQYLKRFGELTNLWKYNLPEAWRLIYTLDRDKINILSIILEWMDHKVYEKRFKY